MLRSTYEWRTLKLPFTKSGWYRTEWFVILSWLLLLLLLTLLLTNVFPLPNFFLALFFPPLSFPHRLPPLRFIPAYHIWCIQWAVLRCCRLPNVHTFLSCWLARRRIRSVGREQSPKDSLHSCHRRNWQRDLSKCEHIYVRWSPATLSRTFRVNLLFVSLCPYVRRPTASRDWATSRCRGHPKLSMKCWGSNKQQYLERGVMAKNDKGTQVHYTYNSPTTKVDLLRRCSCYPPLLSRMKE